MIIRRLHLHPFAGTADREVIFAPGLNVVLGPNEAGKSTLRKALRQVLFVPTKLTKRQADEEVLPYLPLSGGDTVRVSVDLVSGGRTWKLTKRWASGQSSSELHLPDGGILSEVDAVETALTTLRGLSQGTWEHVLFATQGGLASSLDRLGEKGATDDLNEILRRSVFETDGVSLEKLKQSLEERRAKAFGHWDTELNRPEGNRGVEKPWVKEVGTILSAWYDRERARVIHSEAEIYYRRLDELNVRLGAAAAESDSLKIWVESHEVVARDTGKRAGLEGKLAQVEAKGSGLKQISQEWPVAESKRIEHETLAGQLKGKASALALELANAKAWEAAGKSRTLLEEGEKRFARIVSVRALRDAAPVVEAAQTESLESLQKEQDRLRARLEAARLKVVFRATKAISLETRSGVGEKTDHSLATGDRITLDAGGRAMIREAGGDWEIEVSSGDIDVVKEEKRHHEIELELAAGLAKIGAKDLAGARELRSACQEIARDLALAEKQLKDLLGPSRTIEDLRAEVNGAGGKIEAPSRSVGDLAAEQARADAEARAAEKEANALKTRIAGWIEAYQSADALLDHLVDLRAEHQKLKGEIDALLPLPPGVPDARTFLDEFARKKDLLDQQKSAMNQLLVEKAALEGRAPALEPADAVEQVTQTSLAFERALREGAAIEKIRQNFELLRSEMDGGNLTPWLTHLSGVLAPLTSERYRGLRLEEGRVSRNDALTLPFDVLSAGTRASLGLAVRLSMARWFLEGSDGFLILDDPLVDLDPERQEAAAAMLKHFAKDKQVILLTCHPRHAELFGGKTVDLSSS
ncbi:MAG: AAA family ATPase [Verrucomicrobiales bacterium]|nr:AAA family ATPase [Verrucomicrobiales bacterium]